MILIQPSTVRFASIFKKFLIAFLGIWTNGQLMAQSSEPRLSRYATVSVITCGPGELLYEAFGHSAVRIQDPQQNLDLVFNYGIFDFEQENFYGNFAKGSMRYMLGVSEMPNFLEAYRRYGRSVREQELNLDSLEKQRVLDFLSRNLRPENREYFYNYFRDNCSTRIILMLDSALNHSIVWTPSRIEGKSSYRKAIYDYTTYQDWGRLGIDLGLGMPIDQAIEGKALNFLPEELEKSVNRARIRRGVVDFPLVKSHKVLFETEVFHGASSFFSSPAFLFSLLLMAVLFLGWKMPHSFPFRVIRGLLLGFAGILGWVELLIWLFTNHTDAAWNCNLFWANPLILFLLVYTLRPGHFPRIWKGLCYYYGAILACWFLMPQELNVSLLPLVGALAAAAWFSARPFAEAAPAN